MSPHARTHKRSHDTHIYLGHVPFILGEKLQPQTILSDLKKTVISTFPVIIAPFYHSGAGNNGAVNPSSPFNGAHFPELLDAW